MCLLLLSLNNLNHCVCILHNIERLKEPEGARKRIRSIMSAVTNHGLFVQGTGTVEPSETALQGVALCSIDDVISHTWHSKIQRSL